MNYTLYTKTMQRMFLIVKAVHDFSLAQVTHSCKNSLYNLWCYLHSKINIYLHLICSVYDEIISKCAELSQSTCLTKWYNLNDGVAVQFINDVVQLRTCALIDKLKRRDFEGFCDWGDEKKWSGIWKPFTSIIWCISGKQNCQWGKKNGEKKIVIIVQELIGWWKVAVE